ncbi:sialoadhesin-like [Gadus macrocephalus]|uniref:sialoadhesin-like n=1 Tax=Gadus macrocephalus TaxID=80720 RepID=UPI0028CBBE3A|nr:sialoadhesin-like [Gadus macrocephalus]
MDLRSAARGFLAFLLSVPVLQGNGDWRVTYSSTNVCALRGAMVDINCTYEYHNNVQYRPTTVRTLWFTKGDKYQPVDLLSDSDYTGRVENSCGKVNCTGSRCHGTCTLRIRDLRQSDSAVYKFRFTTNQPSGGYTGDPGVTLSLTDLQVKVSFPDPTDPTWTKLECHSMCGLAGDPPYIWFRNGKKGRQGVNYKGHIPTGENYSCAVEGYERLSSPLVYAPKTPSVTMNPSGEIKEGSSVTLSCSSDANPAANYTWFKVIKGPFSTNLNQGPKLVFKQILTSDSGQYYCLVQTELRQASNWITIHMKYGPKHTSVCSNPSGEIEEGSSVTLSCSSDANPAATYTWFKEHEDSVKETGQNYTITNITSEHEGNYYCQAHNAIGHHDSTFLFIQSNYSFKIHTPPSKSKAPSETFAY